MQLVHYKYFLDQKQIKKTQCCKTFRKETNLKNFNLVSLYWGFIFVNADGSSVEERGGEDEQRGAWGHWEVPAAAGQDAASV